MMGSKQRSFAPHIQVSLEEFVPRDHFYRHVERTLALSFVREFVHQTYAGGGRPSIDPVVFFKLQLVMFFEGICSEQQLMRHAADRLSMRWYIGYDLNETLPDHSSLTKIRTRYGIEFFRRFFEEVVEQCQQAGLVWGRELYLDSTKVEANASIDSVKPRFFVEAHLAHVFSPEAEERSAEGEQEESQEEPTPSEHEELSAPSPLPTSLSAEEYQALAQRNEERHDWILPRGSTGSPCDQSWLSSHG
jgi:transposase